jgi:hypothetical protein
MLPWPRVPIRYIWEHQLHSYLPHSDNLQLIEHGRYIGRPHVVQPVPVCQAEAWLAELKRLPQESSLVAVDAQSDLMWVQELDGFIVYLGAYRKDIRAAEKICDMVVGLGALEILVCLGELAAWADDEEVDTGADFEGQGEEGSLWRFGIVFKEAW